MIPGIGFPESSRNRLHANIVGSMPTSAPLGEFEVAVLMAVLHLGDAAVGVAVRDEIAHRTGRTVARGAVYVTLDRLETKGLLTSRMDDATPERGGHRRRYFKVT